MQKAQARDTAKHWADLQAIMQEELLREQAEDQAWWDSLDSVGRAQALRQVSKLIYQAEVEDRGSYRHAMYDIFQVDYCDGISHYIALHNLLSKALDNQPS